MKIQKLDSKVFQFIKNSSIAALIFGAAILFYSCENDIEEIKAFSSTENLPSMEAYNSETLFTDSGQVRFFLKAPKVLIFDNEGQEILEFPEGMELVKYDANKEIISSITSDYAKQFVKDQKWEAKNNVIATNAQGDTLKTEHLIWSEKEETIKSEEFVEIKREDAIYTGVGLVSDQALVNWRIKKLKGIVYVTVDNDKSNSDNKSESDSSIDATKNKAFRGPLQFEE